MTRTDETRPKARGHRLVVEELDGEVLIYDLERDRAHCLNDTAARVWRGCDGRRSVAEIAAAAGLGISEVRYALARLERSRLLESGETTWLGPSRREVLKRAAIAGVALPVVRSIIAPTAAQAATCIPGGGLCGGSAECCSGVCAGGTCL
ncbi:MAG TPA: PqqD family protein [Actinomycetota bacterium]